MTLLLLTSQEKCQLKETPNGREITVKQIHSCVENGLSLLESNMVIPIQIQAYVYAPQSSDPRTEDFPKKIIEQTKNAMRMKMLIMVNST